jgi:hypothetical protein
MLLAIALALSPIAATAQTYAPGNPVTDGNPLPVKTGAPLRAASTTIAGTIAAANAYQTVLAADALRKGCTIQNKSAATMRLHLGATAAAADARAFDLPAGGTFACNGDGLVITDEISIASATAGAAFVVARQ